MTIELGSVAAWIAACVAVWAALVARRSASTASKAYQLNAAKEWADRVAGIDLEYQLIGYLKKDLDASLRPYFNRSGGLNSSALIDMEAEVNKLCEDAHEVSERYPFGTETKRVLSTTNATAFASLVAELERDRAKIRGYRLRLETLSDRTR